MPFNKPRTLRAPERVYRDGLTVGQLARQWERPGWFVHGLVSEGKLNTDEHGCVTIKSLREFYRNNPHPMGG